MGEPVVTRERRRALAALAIFLASGAAGCDTPASDASSSSSTGSWSGGPEDLSDVIYEGGATDEALVALLAHTPVGGPDDGAKFVSPTDGASLPAASPYAFSWTAVVARATPTWPERALDLLLGGVRTAYAHGAPISGRAYFVVFQTPTNAKLLRVFTTNLAYTPDAAAWQRLVDAGAFTVVIGDAIFDENKVAADGGPFVGPPISVSVK